MTRSHRFQHRASIRFWLVMAASGLVIGTSPRHGAAQDDAAASKSDAAQERLFSGPQAGEKVKPFKVLHVKAEESKEVEVLGGDEGIALTCFVHRLSNDDRILYGLGLVDFYAIRHKELKSHIVLLHDDREKITTMLRGWSRGPLFPKSQVSLSLDGADGPGYYGLNRNAAMTVLVTKGDKVVTNLVFNAPNQRDLQKIMAAVARAFGKPEPTLAKVQQELRADRQRRADERMKASPVFKLAPNPELGRIMFGMVNARGNRSLNATRRSKQLLEWTNENDERMAVLKKYCRAVLDGNFTLNQYSRAALEVLAEE